MKDTHKGIRRFQIGINVLVQLIVTALIIWMINFFAYNHFKRWDFSRNQKYALSDQTKRLLKGLKKPVKVIVFFSEASDIFGDVDSLLKEYQYASRKKIEIETLNPYRNLTRAREVVNKYKLGPNENVLIADCEGRSKVVNASDMAEYDTSNAMMGQPPQLTGFKGEQALTSALLEITEAKQNKLYLLAGHGEPEITSPNLSAFKTYIERQNIKFESLNLMNVEKLPDDAKAILIASPKYDFSERETKMLHDFWESKGRFFITLDPASASPRLTAFLDELGIKRNNDRILATLTISQGLTGVVKDPAAEFADGSPITKKLKGVTTQFFGGTQSLKLEPERVQAQNIRVQNLVTAAKGFWGETDYEGGETTGYFFDANKDHGAPLSIAASVEKGAMSDAHVKVDSSRMVVVANAQCITNEGLTEPGLDFLLGSLNWLIDREELIGIAPKASKAFSLSLTDSQVGTIAMLSMAIIPGLAAVAGLAAWWRRRR
jgi:hypothetical protein